MQNQSKGAAVYDYKQLLNEDQNSGVHNEYYLKSPVICFLRASSNRNSVLVESHLFFFGLSDLKGVCLSMN